MRNGIVVEKEWVATLRHFHPERWLVRDGVRLNDPTRGKVDVWLDLPDPIEPLSGAIAPMDSVLVEVKRTDGNLKDSYLYQVCSYLEKAGSRCLGKLVMDHRHTVAEITVLRAGQVYRALDETGAVVQEITRDDLHDLVSYHLSWMDEIGDSYNARFALPDGIASPLDFWQCYRNWRKRDGRALFRCPMAGYCFGIQAEEFTVTNERNGRKIAARIVVSDDGQEFRHEEMKR
jgi:hypothetical protein